MSTGDSVPKARVYGTEGHIEIDGEVIGFLPLRVGGSTVRIGQTILRLRGATPGHAKTDLTRPIARASAA